MRIIVLVISMITVLTISAQHPTKEQVKQVEDAKKAVKAMNGEAFPEFKLTTVSGEEVSSENTKGKIVLFNFWFTRCGPCIKEIPELNELVEEFKNEDVLFIAPTFDDDAQVEKFLTRFDFDYKIVADVKDFCLELNIRSYPTHFVINKDGTIEKVMIGYSMMTVKSLRKSLRKLLKE
ncbi:MAG: TlpA family protein disulfide reductase [Ekhidna sp.]